MYIDILGKNRLKINLHTHTTGSDGQSTPEETATIYKSMGYDMIAITDHWVYGENRIINGLPIISGCEYNLGGADSAHPVFHMVAIGTLLDPMLTRDLERNNPSDLYQLASVFIAKIRNAGGLVNLAHPAWSLNTPEMMMRIPGGFDATEIYNSVSDFGMSDRAYSDLIVDQLGSAGVYPPLLATDDTHYYTGDQGRGFIMLEADAFEEMGLVEAIRAKRFYASMGPEVHLDRVDENRVRVRCSPATKVEFMSHLVWTNGRITRGENITEATYDIQPEERFVRAVVYDKDNRAAWSNVLELR